MSNQGAQHHDSGVALTAAALIGQARSRDNLKGCTVVNHRSSSAISGHRPPVLETAGHTASSCRRMVDCMFQQHQIESTPVKYEAMRQGVWPLRCTHPELFFMFHLPPLPAQSICRQRVWPLPQQSPQIRRSRSKRLASP